MRTNSVAILLAAVGVMVAGPAVVRAAEVDVHHIQITTSSPSEGVRWYSQHLGCKPIADRTEAATCGRVELFFVARPTMGSTQGTGVNHIAFSFADLSAKVAELEKVGVRGTGVRLQRFEDGSMIRELPGLFKHGFIFDPWGTRIELVEDPALLGFHHIHLNAANPDATLTWYRTMLGGQTASLKGRQNGLRFGEVWLFVSPQEATTSTASTRNRAIDHVAFVVKEFDKGVADLRQRNVTFVEQPGVPEGGRTPAKAAILSGPDSVRVEVVETGFAGVRSNRGLDTVTTDAREPYTTPKLPWGEPDLQGLYSGNTAHGIPLERPRELANVKALTPEEAAARRERGTLASIWGYEREWRDTTLEYTKRAPSTQVAIVVDPPDGMIPPITEAGRKRIQETIRRETAGNEDTNLSQLPAGPEDLSTFVRCITRGLPGMMIPIVYNNGLQIVQGPGFVAIQNEMMHETRLIPTQPRERRSARLTTWLGEPQGRWEGDTLVVESTNFNGKSSFRGSSPKMKLVERFTRVAPNVLEYKFTIEDPETWTRPWTGMFHFDKDDSQYELVEYACHEANYGIAGILSGARATEKARPKTK